MVTRGDHGLHCERLACKYSPVRVLDVLVTCDAYLFKVQGCVETTGFGFVEYILECPQECELLKTA